VRSPEPVSNVEVGNTKKYFRLFVGGIQIIRLYKNWFNIISNYFKADKGTTEVILRNGIKYKIRPKNTDMGLIHEIHSENVYQIQKGDISDNAVVIDIGAHIGIFSIFAAIQTENVTVYSFEPDPGNFQFLLNNVKVNHLEDKIRPFNLAVSNTNTPRKLIRSAASLTAHSLFANKFPRDEVKDSLEVACTTLPDIFEGNKVKKCDVLKLDCEGGEYDILLNAPDKILSKIGMIVAEYHDGLTSYTREDLRNFLENRNFEIKVEKSRSFPTFSVGFLYACNTVFKRG